MRNDEYISQTVNILPISALNPTICIGFLIQNKAQHSQFINWIKEVKATGKHFIDYMDKEPIYCQNEEDVMDF